MTMRRWGVRGTQPELCDAQQERFTLLLSMSQQAATSAIGRQMILFNL